MEAGEGVEVVGKLECVFRVFREGVSDCVGAIMLQHEFGDLCFAFAFVVVAVIFSGEHDKVANLIDILWCLVFIGMVFLVYFGSKEVVLYFLNIKIYMFDNAVCSCLFDGSIFS
jgi:hypothetical protein